MHSAGQSLVICERCGKLHRWPSLSSRAVARCTQCEAVLGRGHLVSVETLLALTLAAGSDGSDAAAEPSGTASLLGAPTVDKTVGVGGFVLSHALKTSRALSAATVPKAMPVPM